MELGAWGIFVVLTRGSLRTLHPILSSSLSESLMTLLKEPLMLAERVYLTLSFLVARVRHRANSTVRRITPEGLD